MIDLGLIWVDMECPNCGYADQVQLIDAKSERTIFCVNCKKSIQLVDNEASVHSTLETVSKVFKELNDVFKKFGK